MTQSPFTPADFIDVRVNEPGDDCNLYDYDLEVQAWRLSGLHRAAQPAPVDQGVALGTVFDGEAGLGIWLLTHRPAFPGCVVSARPIALLEARRGTQPVYHVLTVSAADETLSHVNTPEDLPQAWYQALVTWAQTQLTGGGTSITWRSVARAQEVIHQAKQAARLARAEAHKKGAAAPVWKPLGRRVAGARRSSDTEPHTEAEHAYHQLPPRFQKYVDEYLTPRERVLFAVNRPAMKSALRASWAAPPPQLQEGILFITDQQVALVTEILPPGQSSIRYGYIVQTGVPERISAITLRPLGAHVGLEITWNARSGSQPTVWEFPAESAEELREGAELLQGWQPLARDQRVRRAYGPAPQMMALRDPAANDPAEIEALAERLTQAVTAQIFPGEQVLARALLPAWADRHKTARVFAVTDRRALLAPDASGRRHRPESFGLEQITSVEFTASILKSELALNLMRGSQGHRLAIDIPNTAASFQVCFTALRQQLTAVSIWGAGSGEKNT